MENYFKRQIQLWGSETQHLLSTRSIAIIGCGGLGSSLALALGASGIGTIYCVDFDTVGIHNIHRQIAFTCSDEGQKKCHVVTQLIHNRCPYTHAIAVDGTIEDFSQLGVHVDLILDATDNLLARQTIERIALELKTPWIYASVEEFHGQVCFFEEGRFASIFQMSDHKPGGIAAPIVMQLASLEANLALRYLVGLPVKRDLLYYCYYQQDGEYCVKKFHLS